jgi:hypothetical protein
MSYAIYFANKSWINTSYIPPYGSSLMSFSLLVTTTGVCPLNRKRHFKQIHLSILINLLLVPFDYVLYGSNRMFDFWQKNNSEALQTSELSLFT